MGAPNRWRIRQAGGLVIHTQSVRSPDALEFTVFKNTVRKLEGTWGSALIDDLKPAADEPLIVKHTRLFLSDGNGRSTQANENCSAAKGE